MSRLLSIVRTATTLDAYRLEAPAAIAPPLGDRPWPTAPAWRITRAPLPDTHPLQSTWARLSRPRPLDGALRADVIEILSQTVPDPASRWPVVPLPAEAPPPPRATAANPRAFRGTRHQPPKPFTPTLADARPHLSGSRDTRALLERLAPFGAPPTADADPGWSATFRTVWAPALAAQGALAPLYGAWRRLGLDRDGDLAAAALALTLDVGPSRALRWLDALAGLSAAARTPWLHAVIGTGLAAAGLNFDRPLVALHDALDGPARWPRVWLLCTHRLAGGGAQYLLQGLALRDRCRWPDALDPRRTPPAVEAVDEGPLWHHLTYTAGERGRPERSAVSLWQACGRLPGLIDLLADLAERTAALSPVVAERLVAMARSVDDHGWAEAPDPARWTWLHGQRRRLLDAVVAVAPGQRIKAVDLLWNAVLATDDAATLRALMQRQLRVLPHVCAGPSTTRWVCDPATELSETLDDAHFDRLLDAPPLGWRRLAEACHTKNPASLIAHGVAALGATAPALLIDGFIHVPGPLWRTAGLLGGMRPERSRHVVHRLLRRPLAHRDWAEWPLDALCAALTEVVGDGVPDPVPRKLKRHLSGERPLTAGQLERVRQQLLRPERRVAVLLGLLRAAVVHELTRTAAAERVDAGVLHALQIVATIDDNRRILRRVLRARWRGESDPVRRHPRTRAWWAAHPELPEDIWHAEHRLTSDDPPATLNLEGDPIEILRLGTAVGSCIGLGGALTYSAAAIAVDDNKRVIYARDRDGRVLARQVVALDDDGRLVCFEIYPYETQAPLRALFARFARRLAERLRTALYDPDEDDGYIVDLILAEDWWDDDAPGIRRSEASSETPPAAP